MKVLIIEDEIFAAEAIEKMVRELRQDTVVLEKIPSVEEAVSWLKNNPQPELIFCDIHLSDGNSFDIFKQVSVSCPVIFTTAFDKYAIEAFQVNSIDYLLKPIKNEELSRAIAKYESLNSKSFNNQVDNLQNLLRDMQKRVAPTSRTRFMVKSGQSLRVIPSEEVAYFLAEEGIVLLVNFEGKRFAGNNSLDQLEEQLDKHSFFRANRQLIVNISAVKKVEPYFKGRLLLQTDPSPKEDQIVSSSKASAFKSWLDL